MKEYEKKLTSCNCQHILKWFEMFSRPKKAFKVQKKKKKVQKNFKLDF